MFLFFIVTDMETAIQEKDNFCPSSSLLCPWKSVWGNICIPRLAESETPDTRVECLWGPPGPAADALKVLLKTVKG